MASLVHRRAALDDLINRSAQSTWERHSQQALSVFKRRRGNEDAVVAPYTASEVTSEGNDTFVTYTISGLRTAHDEDYSGLSRCPEGPVRYCNQAGKGNLFSVVFTAPLRLMNGTDTRDPVERKGWLRALLEDTFTVGLFAFWFVISVIVVGLCYIFIERPISSTVHDVLYAVNKVRSVVTSLTK